MKAMQRVAVSTVAAAVLLGLVGCGEMTTRQKDTAIGAGVGAVGGNVLTGGSAVEYFNIPANRVVELGTQIEI